MEIETRHYDDETSATGVAPLPDLSPSQQDIKEALVVAKEFILWPATVTEMKRVVAMIDKALAHLT